MNDDEATIITSVSPSDSFEPGKVLVVLKKSATIINHVFVPAYFSGIGVSAVEDLSYIGNSEARDWVDEENYHQILLLTLTTNTKQGVIDAIRLLELRDDVLCATPNYVANGQTEEDALSSLSLLTNEQSVSIDEYPYSTIGLSQAWDITTGDSQILVGIMDGGIAAENPDISANCMTSLGINVTGNGEDPWDPSQNYHGTQVASVIGAVRNDGSDPYGVCQNVGLVSIQIMIERPDSLFPQYSEYVFTSEWFCRGLQYAVAQKIPIVNMSINSGDGRYLSCFPYAIQNYPGLFVVSAGNQGENVDDPETPFYPDVYPSENMIVVGATDETDRQWIFSNYGAVSVDLAAPGERIPTSRGPVGAYGRFPGTSLSAPFVAGTAALIKSIRPELTTLEIRDLILGSVDEIAALSGSSVTGGRLNVYEALLAAQRYPHRGNLLSGDFDGDGDTEVRVLCREETFSSLWEYSYWFDNLFGLTRVWYCC